MALLAESVRVLAETTILVGPPNVDSIRPRGVMARCGVSGVNLTPLARYARSMKAHLDADLLPMLFPMYTVPLETLLKMTKAEPHEELKAQGVLVEFERHRGQAAFVSHQWVSRDHPDPEFKQMRVLQDALKEMMGSLKSIPVNPVTEVAEGNVKPIPTSRILSEPLFFWYDYFSCPQKERLRLSMGQNPVSNSGRSLMDAINSIPAYVSKSAFFLALVPVVENPSKTNLITTLTWQARGWCRLERTCRELSQEDSWIIVKGARDLEVIGSMSASLRAGSGPVGDGIFTVAKDRFKLGPVLMTALKSKMLSLLKAQDLAGYRAFLNQQPLLFRGLDVNFFDPLGLGEDQMGLDSSELTQFFHQNGFRSVRETDSGGWSPLHYAALNGNPSLVQDLLEGQADPNQGSKKVHPSLGHAAGTPPLSIACLFKNNEAARLLISAKAKVTNGMLIHPPFICACTANNTQAIELLCGAGCNPRHINIFGVSPMETAAYYGGLEAMEELLRSASASDLDPTAALYNAVFGGGGSEVVHRLVELRADVNAQTDDHWKRTKLMRAVYSLTVLQHRIHKVCLA